MLLLVRTGRWNLPGAGPGTRSVVGGGAAHEIEEDGNRDENGGEEVQRQPSAPKPVRAYHLDGIADEKGNVPETADGKRGRCNIGKAGCKYAMC